MRAMFIADLLREYTPGSADWSWDDEERDLLSHECRCHLAKPEGTPPCDIKGHYQLRLEAHLREVGQIEQGVCLGTDGRIWDGHHRIVAARRLGFLTIPIEED